MTVSPAPTHAPDQQAQNRHAQGQQAQNRHTPERTCVACRRRRPQSAFTRLTRVDGVWSLSTGHRAGRGAYVCSDTPECWQDRRLRRAFGAQAPQVAAALTTALTPCGGEPRLVTAAPARSGRGTESATPHQPPQPPQPLQTNQPRTLPPRGRDGSHRR